MVVDTVVVFSTQSSQWCKNNVLHNSSIITVTYRQTDRRTWSSNIQLKPRWYASLIQTSGLLWIRIRTSVLDSLPCRRQSFCQWHLSQAPPKQSAVCYTCIIPTPPVNCQFIWMVSAFGMSATQLILKWLQTVRCPTENTWRRLQAISRTETTCWWS